MAVWRGQDTSFGPAPGTDWGTPQDWLVDGEAGLAVDTTVPSQAGPDTFAGFGGPGDGMVTGSGSAAVIELDGPADPIFAGSFQTGALDINGGVLTLQSGNLTVSQQSGNDGTLDITSGSFSTTAEFDNYDAGSIILSSGSFSGAYVSNYGTITATGGSFTLSDSLDDNGTITFSGGATFSTTSALIIADQSDATFDVRGGATITIGTYADIGSDGNTGEVTIDGSTWNEGTPGDTGQSGDMGIGDGGTGMVTVTNGATVNIGGGIYVGANSSGSGTLTIQGGSVVTVTGQFGVRLAQDPDSSGTLVVTGAGTQLIAGDPSITNDNQYAISTATGTGSVIISNGASAQTEDFFIASGLGGLNGGQSTAQILSGATVKSGAGGVGGQGGTGTITVDAALWQVAGEIDIGQDGGPSTSGSGTLIIQDAGIVTDQVADIGVNAGSYTDPGTVTVTGPGSTWKNSGQVLLGDGSSGSLSVTGGGSVSVTGDFDIAVQPGSTGTATLDNTSSLSVGGDINVGIGGMGTLALSNSVTLNGAVDIGVSSNATGEVAVNTQTSTLSAHSGVTVGDAGTGNLSLTGEVATLYDFTIAAQANAVGSVVMTTSGSLYVAALLTIAEGGTGSLDSSGSITAMNDVDVGALVNSLGNVTLRAGSMTKVAGQLAIGLAGSGMVVDEGSLTTTGDITLGSGGPQTAGSLGKLSVISTGSVMDGGALDVGVSSSGLLDVSGDVQVSQNITVGDQERASGGVDINSGGELRTDNTLTIGSEGNGTVEVHGGGTLVAGAIVIAAGIDSTGTLLVDDGATLVQIQQSWTTGSGNSSEKISNTAVQVNGDYTNGALAGAQATAAINGALAQLMVNGNFSVGINGNANGSVTLTGGASLTIGGQSNIGGQAGQAAGGTGGLSVDEQSFLNSQGITTVGANGGTGDVEDRGKWTSTEVDVGADPATGTITITGDAANWTDTGDAIIGVAGIGELDVSDGATADIQGQLIAGQQDGATGTVSIDASLLTTGDDLIIGSSGSGTLSLDGGGTLDVGGDFTLGDDDGSDGSASLMDGDVIVAGDITIGNGGSGTLDVSIDLVAANGFTIGENGDGSVTIEADGSLTAQDDLIIGNEGNATLIVIGEVKADETIYAGNDTDGSGGITVESGGTLDGDKLLDIGNYGTGGLSVLTGGQVNEGTLTLAAGAGGSGAVSVDGGSIELTDQLFVGAGGDSTLEILGGGSVDVQGYAGLGLSGAPYAGVVSLYAGGALSIADSLSMGPGAKVSIDATSQLTVGTIDAVAGDFATSGFVVGGGTIEANIIDDGTIFANDGTLTLTAPQSITGSGTLEVQSSDTLVISATPTLSIATLSLSGDLSLGSTPLEVTHAYTNANWGSGNSFNPSANVLSGSVFGENAGLSVNLSGGGSITDVSGSAAAIAPEVITLTLSQQAGGLYGGSFSFTNTGTPDLTLAVQTSGLTSPAVSLDAVASNVTLAAGGASQMFDITYDPSEGALSGDITLLSDFANLAGVQIDLAEAACYRAGTLIETDLGCVPIEALQPGDFVRLRDGGFSAVRWLGGRRVDCAGHPDPASVWPVRIRAHAFGPDAPRRDLWLSPEHGVAVGGALIPARCLANGVSIVTDPVEEVEYWHLELDRHDLVLAENLPAESFLDHGQRGQFTTQRGRSCDIIAPLAASVPLAPMVTQGTRLAAALQGVRAA